MQRPTCPECDSRNLQPVVGVDDVYTCRDCGMFFEDDTFALNTVREQRDHKIEKFMEVHG